MNKDYIKYSFYVYLNQMGGTLQEAVDFLTANPDAPESPAILSNCADCLKTIKKFLMERRECCMDQAIFDLLDGGEERLRQYSADKSKPDALAEQVDLICQKLRDTLRYKIHAVFYSDLGAKWDAIESVYWEFKKRDDCEVTVVEIPAYRVDKANKVHAIYEDFLTPKGVPFVEFSKYNLKKDCPDVVFHTNPYGGTIPGDFTVEKVAESTRLVYLAYFTDDILDEESMQSNFEMSVSRLAWRIPVISEKLKYYHEKYAFKHGENVIVTGSAKWDSIVNNIRNGCDRIPEWDEKLSGKKVFLWNSHYNLGLKYASTLMQMGDDILDYFKAHPELGLIWRPHPMTETVIEAQLPQCLELWNKWKSFVQHSENMILDTLESYGPAFQYADAMISDRSSMIPQFMLTKKPILFLQRADFSKFERVINIDCLDVAKSFKDCEVFIQQIIDGKDPNREQRLKVIEEDMGLADGHCGERICERIIADMKKEDGVA